MHLQPTETIGIEQKQFWEQRWPVFDSTVLSYTATIAVVAGKVADS